MTQSVTNTVNNLEQMLLNQKDTSKATKDVVSGMDKTTSFNTIFDKKFEKTNKDIKVTDSDKKVLTIADLKTENTNPDKITEGFRDILKKATDEANVETSLDLTLAKDINEIITQLKEAVENATEMIEDSSNKEGISLDNIDVQNIDTVLTTEIDNLEGELLSEEETDSNEKEEVYFQILGSLEKTPLQNLNIDEEIENSSFDMNQTEVIEFSENIIEESISASKVVKTEETQEIELEEYNIEEDILKDLNIESIKVETDGNSDETLMQNQSPEEHAMKAMINKDVEVFEIKVDSTQNIQSSQAQQIQQTKTVEANPSRIIDQVVKHLEVLQNNSKISIVLNPESLGKVNIQLLTTKEGLTAQFTVTTQEARDLIMKGLDGLKESLVSHGVGVDNISVKVSDSQKSEYNQDWTDQEGSRGGNKGQKNPDREEKEKGLFEKMMAQTFEDENGNV